MRIKAVSRTGPVTYVASSRRMVGWNAPLTSPQSRWAWLSNKGRDVFPFSYSRILGGTAFAPRNLQGGGQQCMSPRQGLLVLLPHLCEVKQGRAR